MKLLKNQKGLTLIELLAVIVILGIIAAIAIPSVNTIISNSKKKAQIENARALIDAARYKVNSELISTSSTFTLADLQDEKANYIEKITDPSGNEYNKTSSKVIATEKNGSFTYSVCLVGSDYDIGDGTTCIAESELTDYAFK
jgi:type IV pilus assembly protein PilA